MTLELFRTEETRGEKGEGPNTAFNISSIEISFSNTPFLYLVSYYNNLTSRTPPIGWPHRAR